MLVFFSERKFVIIKKTQQAVKLVRSNQEI